MPQAVAARAPYEWRDTGPLSILRRRQVEVVTGLSRSTIYDRMKVGTFPAAVKIGPHSVGWRAGDIDAFLASPAGYRAQGGRS
ncbi:helix-turn-helix transcriptional regulator [Burkholderia gladioli]|uniref:helix-turn-helix transcriptional regulator n=1 Tax=Burkholderia gladioli TaxID=28095 RepID=UPI00163F667C|nr:AlpA family phage regulatory protein [Burkholderia gladioli]